ncbi:MAG: hypothetical protein M1830_000198 [Pleopsidium flavum]|nr:MAG: hypothetical protein M1830_000198 [Pleopsidium flavum]
MHNLGATDGGLEPVAISDLEVLPHSNTHAFKEQEEPYSSQTREQRQRIGGLKAPTFWGVIIIIIMILAAGIGGGIGAGLSARQKDTAIPSSPGPTSTTLSSTFPSSTTTNTAPSVPCPTSNGNIYTPTLPTTHQNYTYNGNVLQYQILCSTNFAAGSLYGNPGIIDMQVIPGTTSLEACMHSCAVYSIQLPIDGSGGKSLCRGVAWQSENVDSTGAQQCYLKSGVTATSVSTNLSGEFQGAVLLGF